MYIYDHLSLEYLVMTVCLFDHCVNPYKNNHDNDIYFYKLHNHLVYVLEYLGHKQPK